MTTLFVTDSLPIALWARIQTRVLEEFERQDQALADLLRPTVVTVDSAAVQLARTEQAREEAVRVLWRLELLQSLNLTLKQHLHHACETAGLPRLQQSIECFRELVRVYAHHTAKLPRRALLEEDVRRAVEQFAAVKTAGQGESAVAERARLRAFQCEMPVMGAEDAAPYEAASRRIQAMIDQLEAQVQAGRAEHRFALTVRADMAEELRQLGVELREQAPAGEAAPA